MSTQKKPRYTMLSILIMHNIGTLLSFPHSFWNTHFYFLLHVFKQTNKKKGKGGVGEDCVGDTSNFQSIYLNYAEITRDLFLFNCEIKLPNVPPHETGLHPVFPLIFLWLPAYQQMGSAELHIKGSPLSGRGSVKFNL